MGKKPTYKELEQRVKELEKEAGKLKAAQEELKRYQFMIESAHDAIFFKDLESRYITANDKTIEAFGLPREDVIGKNDYDLMPDPKEAQKNVHDDQIVFKSGKSTEIFKHMTGADGNEYWFQAIKVPQFDNDGKVIGLVGIARDITERKRADEEKKKLEARLRQAQRMEAIGTLAGGVAHDLNNILSGIISYPELLLLELPQDSPFRKPILEIKKSGEKAVATVQDLLTLARRGVAVTEIVNLNHIISEYIKSPEHEKLQLFYPSTHVETRLETDLLNIMGSPVHLTKTVMNLITNAFEAILNGGKVSISTRNQYVDKPIKGYDEVREGDYVVLKVADDGIGMSPENMEHIFEPFYTKKVMGKSGTGLGMAVVWGAVRDHDGYIDIQSNTGKGTTFTLYFPVTRKDIAKDEALLPLEAYIGDGESVLVVDDVEEQREIATVMLRKLGYSVTSVSSGEEAVEYMKSNSPDLIVLDMIMDPGINGRETYERIVKSHPLQKTIIASGFSETDDVKAIQKLGAGRYIKKPYTLEKIGIAIRDELKNQLKIN